MAHRYRRRYQQFEREVTHPITIVVDLKTLMCVDVDVLIIFGLLRGEPHEAPYWQLIHEQLIPVMLFDSLSEGCCLTVSQHIVTDYLLGHIGCR